MVLQRDTNVRCRRSSGMTTSLDSHLQRPNRLYAAKFWRYAEEIIRSGRTTRHRPSDAWGGHRGGHFFCWLPPWLRCGTDLPAFPMAADQALDPVTPFKRAGKLTSASRRGKCNPKPFRADLDLRSAPQMRHIADLRSRSVPAPVRRLAASVTITRLTRRS